MPLSCGILSWTKAQGWVCSDFETSFTCRPGSVAGSCIAIHGRSDDSCLLAAPPPKRKRLHLSGASVGPRAPKELLLFVREGRVRRAFLDARILCLLKPLPGVSIGPRPSAITSLTVYVCRWQLLAGVQTLLEPQWSDAF